ncbi:MAG TPA: YciI family protein [Ktedonosporobacter sp.]|nr:YciI family protein [Ktedonosporobacter sp.]
MTENKDAWLFEVPPDMTVYYLRIFRRGPTWTPGETPELERLQEAHLAYGRTLYEAGKVVINGPLLDGGDLRGVSVMRVESLEEARALSEADPSVQVGRLSFELHPWMVHKGILPE